MLGGVDPSRPALRRPGCLGWLLIAGVLLLVGLVVLGAWLRSAGDLDAEAARGRALGIPMAGDLPPEEPTGLRDWLVRLEMACLRAKPVQTELASYMSDPWRPAPELLTWSSGVDADLDALIDAAPVGSLRHPPGRPLAERGRHYEGTAIARACELLLWRSEADADPGAILQRLAALAAAPHGPMPLQCWDDAERAWLMVALRQRGRLDPAATAAAARRLAEASSARLDSRIREQPAAWEAVLRQPPQDLLRMLQVMIPRLMDLEYSSGIWITPRCGRRRILARAVEAAAWVRTHGAPQRYADLAAMSPPIEALGMANTLWELFPSIVDDIGCAHCRGSRTSRVRFLAERVLERATHLRLLAADLDGAPWPTDPGDPAGGPLRPIRRDGVVIGGYSVGPDGRDDGGDRKTDRCWPLRAVLGSPRAADPPRRP